MPSLELPRDSGEPDQSKDDTSKSGVKPQDSASLGKLSDSSAVPSPGRDLVATRSPDAILIVGRKPNQRNIRVNSGVLRNASKVFEDLILQDSRSSDPDSLLKIDLSDDDGPAMTWICQMLHRKSDLIPRSLNGTQIMNLGAIVSKYDLHATLQLDLQSVLQTTQQQMRHLDLSEGCNVLVGSYRMKVVDMFNTLSRSMLFRVSTRYLPGKHPGVPTNTDEWMIAAGLEHKRQEIYVDLMSVVNKFLAAVAQCDCLEADRYAAGFAQLILPLFGRQPEGTLSLFEVVRQLKELALPEWTLCQCDKHGESERFSRVYHEMLSKKLDAWERKYSRGLDYVHFHGQMVN